MNGDDKLHLWWELSYASWLTLPRVLMQEMPEEWCNQMADLLEQFDTAYPNKLDISTHVSFKKNGKYTAGPKWLSNYRRPDYREINKMKGNDE